MTPEMERRASIKGPMTKYMLRFDKVSEVYSLVEKKFTSANTNHTNSKSKFHNKVPCSAIPTILISLGVPEFKDMDKLIQQYFISKSGKDSIDLKTFLIGLGNLVWKQGVERVSVEATEEHVTRDADGDILDDVKKGVDYGASVNIDGFIDNITPGSTADKAGLRVGDKIEEINGHPVNNGGGKYKISLYNGLNMSVDQTKVSKLTFQRDLAKAQGITSSNQQSWDDLKEGFATVEAMFDDIDTDKGGSLDFEEFCDAFSAMGSKDESTVALRLKELDLDGNKEIDRDEFIFGISAWVGFADDEDLDSDRVSA